MGAGGEESGQKKVLEGGSCGGSTSDYEKLESPRHLHLAVQTWKFEGVGESQYLHVKTCISSSLTTSESRDPSGCPLLGVLASDPVGAQLFILFHL